MREPIKNVGIDDLAPPGAIGFQHPADDAVGQHHSPSAKITYEIERDDRGTISGPDHVQSVGQCKVVDVVAGASRKSSVQAPGRHATINKYWIQLPTVCWTEIEALHDARTESLDGGVHRPLDGVDRFQIGSLLEVERDRARASAQEFLARVTLGVRARAINDDDVCSQIGQKHSSIRAWPDSPKLEDVNARQRSLHFRPL